MVAQAVRRLAVGAQTRVPPVMVAEIGSAVVRSSGVAAAVRARPLESRNRFRRRHRPRRRKRRAGARGWCAPRCAAPATSPCGDSARMVEACLCRTDVVTTGAVPVGYLIITIISLGNYEIKYHNIMQFV